MASNPKAPHFVWVKGVGGGIEPQKWGELNYGVNNRVLKEGTVVAVHEITDNIFQLGIDDLVKLYPPPSGYTYQPQVDTGR